MSQAIIGKGGNPIPSLQLVATDNETIFGDGSGQNPLTTNGAGAGSRQIQTASFPDPGPQHPVGTVVRQTSIDGQVTVALATVTADTFATGLISSINDDGTVNYVTSGLLKLTPAEWIAVTDNASILTPGQPYYLSAANAGNLTLTPPSGDAYVVQLGVAYDENTLLINTPVPLAPSTSVATPANAPALGMALRVTSSGHMGPLLADGSVAPECSGLVKSLNTDGSLTYHNDGPLTLTTGQWDAIVTGESGGLTPGSNYYVSAAAAGKLTTTPPVATGSYQVFIGQALSATTLIAHIGFPVGPHS